jgi:hypothetical protein
MSPTTVFICLLRLNNPPFAVIPSPLLALWKGRPCIEVPFTNNIF